MKNTQKQAKIMKNTQKQAKMMKTKQKYENLHKKTRMTRQKSEKSTKIYMPPHSESQTLWYRAPHQIWQHSKKYACITNHGIQSAFKEWPDQCENFLQIIILKL